MHDETDLNARYYDPLLERFISPDPLVPEPGNPQALNRYAYVLNNPLRYTDPSGHCVTNDYEITRGDPFDCTVEEMAQLAWAVRQWWLQMLMKEAKAGWFYNILGILDYFANDPQMAPLDGWASLADAGVLVVIQDGWRMHSGKAPVDTRAAARQASSAWQKFFELLAVWGHEDPRVHQQWGLAEQAGVNFGVAIAEPLRAQADAHTQIEIDIFVWAGNRYRDIIAGHADVVLRLAKAHEALAVFDPRTDTSRRFVRGVSQNVISPLSAGHWGLYQSATRPYPLSPW